MFRHRIALVVMVVIYTFTMAKGAEEIAIPPHPRLLFNKEGLDQFRQKISHQPWAGLWAKLKAKAEKSLDQKIDLPPRGGNWAHNYVCPTHGARLKRGWQIGPWQWEHICPIGPHTLTGDPSKATLDFDGNSIASAHDAYTQEVRDLGLVYQVTGDKRFADRADAILLAYAEKYLSYPMHNNRGQPVTSNGGRIASQPLSEANVIIPFAQGADLVWDTLSPAQRKTLEDKLFRPALQETILNKSKKAVIHNIQCHRNSAVGLVGFLLGDKDLIHSAIDGISGFRAQMARGVQADGVWHEGSWGYHFYTITGTWPLTEAARNCGIDLYGTDFKKLFDAPLNLANPNFTLPPFNDSGEVRIFGSPLYELALARYKNPTYAAVLDPSHRTSDFALWFGVDELPTGKVMAAGSRNAQASGYSILQKGEGQQATWLCLKYGPHGGGHGHFDKLNFVLYARGQMWGYDTGTHAYGSPLHADWDKISLAHNTLTVNEKCQAEATGKCLLFGSEKGVDYVMADAGPIYKGLRFVRTALLLNENLVVFVDQVAADRSSTLDIAFHIRGKWADLPPSQLWSPPAAPGYKCIRAATTRNSKETLRLPLTTGEKSPANMLIALAGGETTELITGLGIGASTADEVPMVLFRRKASRSTFVWAVSLDGTAPELSAQADPAATAAKVTVTAASTHWQLEINSAKPSVKIGP